MTFRYREMIYRPDFYEFDIKDRTEWYPNGIFNYNISRMIKDLQNHELSNDNKSFLNSVFKAPVSVSEAIKRSYGGRELQEKHIDQADITRPLIYVEIAPDGYNLIDGNHRLAKAKRDGIDTLEAYFMPAHTAIHYLGSEKEYSKYVEYWNSKIEDILDEENYVGLYVPEPAPILERDLDPRHIWNRISMCLNECRRIELYSEGEWFTLFRLNGRLFCGEAEAHQPSVKCASPFAVSQEAIADAVPAFEAWQGLKVAVKAKTEVRKSIRKSIRHAGILMACIRIFSEY